MYLRGKMLFQPSYFNPTILIDSLHLNNCQLVQFMQQHYYYFQYRHYIWLFFGIMQKKDDLFSESDCSKHT